MQSDAGIRTGREETGPVSVRLDAGVNERVSAVAGAPDRPNPGSSGRPPDFVAMPECQSATIDEGLCAADARRVSAGEDVVAWVR